MYRWLEALDGRRETLVISVKQVRTYYFVSCPIGADGLLELQENDAPPDLFASTLLSLIRSTAPIPSSLSNRTPESFWYTKNEWPRLGDVRGKAVLFCRFAWKGCE